MENTYTFSRALRMMRYGGAKMKPIKWESSCYVRINKYNDLVRVCDGYSMLLVLPSPEIMGSWVEV